MKGKVVTFAKFGKKVDEGISSELPTIERILTPGYSSLCLFPRGRPRPWRRVCWLPLGPIPPLLG